MTARVIRAERELGLKDALRSTYDQERAVEKVREFERKLREPFVDRNAEALAITLALMTKQHVVMIGDPGTSKSQLAVRAARLMDASLFEYLMTSHTDPSELLGPLDIKAYQDGIWRRIPDGRLPEAEVAFLDEIFKGTSGTLNTLLLLINERKYYDGAAKKDAALKTLIGASNEPPIEQELAALYDRILLRCFTRPVPEERRTELEEVGRRNMREGTLDNVQPVLDNDTREILYAMQFGVDLEKIKPLKRRLDRLLESRGVSMTDRRRVWSDSIIAAHAVLNNRKVALPEDLEVLRFIAPSDEEDHETVTGIIYDEIDTPMGRGKRLRDMRREIKSIEGATDMERLRDIIAHSPLETLMEIKASLMAARGSSGIRRGLRDSNEEVREAAEAIARETRLLLRAVNNRYVKIVLAHLKFGSDQVDQIRAGLDEIKSDRDQLLQEKKGILEFMEHDLTQSARESKNSRLRDAMSELNKKSVAAIHEIDAAIEEIPVTEVF